MKGLSLPPKINYLITKLAFKQKVWIYVGTLVVMAAAFILVFAVPQLGEMDKLRLELETAQSTLSAAKRKAANLKQFRAELEATRVQFQKALLLLPDKKEIPSLLTNISNLGNDSGLEFILFKPKEEVPKDFYAEIPVEIIVKGPYHNVAVFFDKVSKLPRIVNISDVRMTDPKMEQGKMVAKTFCLATTYRFVESKPSEGGKSK